MLCYQLLTGIVRMLNNQWLNTFRTLIDIGHFTLTAKKLHMTQPGVSQHVMKLEEACGHSLIKREKKSFELTEKGRLVYEYSLKLAHEEDSLMSHLKFDDPFRGDCSLSCSGSLALKLYSQVLDLQKKHSGIIVHLEAAPNYKILEDIERGVIDIGIVTDTPNRSTYEYKKIGREPLCLILPRRYKGATVTAELLQELGLVNHPDAKMYLSIYLEQCGNPSLRSLNIDELSVVSYVNQLEQIPLAVSKGIGFTILPQSALEKFGKKNSYYIDIPKKLVSEDIFLVQKKSRSLPSRYKTLETCIRGLLKSL